VGLRLAHLLRLGVRRVRLLEGVAHRFVAAAERGQVAHHRVDDRLHFLDAGEARRQLVEPCLQTLGLAAQVVQVLDPGLRPVDLFGQGTEPLGEHVGVGTQCADRGARVREGGHAGLVCDEGIAQLGDAVRHHLEPACIRVRALACPPCLLAHIGELLAGGTLMLVDLVLARADLGGACRYGVVERLHVLDVRGHLLEAEELVVVRAHRRVGLVRQLIEA
jgi:hypothetical protein